MDLLIALFKAVEEVIPISKLEDGVMREMAARGHTTSWDATR